MSAMDLEVFKEAINIACKNDSKPVLNLLPDVLGQLLNAAVTAGDKECAETLIKAGASVKYQKNNFADRLSDNTDRLSNGPYVAYSEYAANMYAKLTSRPSPQDIIESFKDDIDACRKCRDFMKGRYLSSGAEYMETFYFHYSRKAKTPLLLAVEAKDAAVAELLLQNGAEKQVDCGSFNYREHVTPFSSAVFGDWLDGIELFLQYGLDVNRDIERKIIRQSTPEALMIFLRHGLHRHMIEGDSDLAIAAGKFGKKVPKVQQEAEPCSLKFICRTVICEALAESSHQNFFITVTNANLLLPRNLCEYILCGFDPITLPESNPKKSGENCCIM